MQTTITKRITGKAEKTTSGINVEETFGHMPNAEELQKYGDDCEKEYPICDLNSVE